LPFELLRALLPPAEHPPPALSLFYPPPAPFNCLQKIFQIWLNLPRKSKLAPPAFAMHWAESLVRVPGIGGAEATIHAGRLGDVDGKVTPPPDSWAVDPANDVGVVVFSLPAGGSRFTIPASPYGDAINRVLYVTDAGRGMSVGGKRLSGPAAVTLRAGETCELVNGDPGVDAQALLLQGRPIGEPVAQRGPFVMNTQREIMETYAEFQRTRFGGWPWGDEDDEAARAPVFPRDKGRFASYRLPDGTTRVEYPPGAAAGGNSSSSSDSAAAAGGAGKKDEL
jgi:quercetin 2,3-dioxygenase